MNMSGDKLYSFYTSIPGTVFIARPYRNLQDVIFTNEMNTLILISRQFQISG